MPQTKTETINKVRLLQMATCLRSIRYALEGLKELLKEPNAKIHTVATICVIVLGLIQHLDAYRWMALVLAMGLVWVAEGLNTAIEKICDLIIDGKWHPVIKNVKDISAGAVFLASIISVCIGILVFLF